ncbi:YbaB/EbfC family nucleoid-associated protein [Nocardia sp. alder85J]|uniref:YbaB/EbfC family nucleoid-associated protein n=1 Tax=Nocardia sp. alder85J TaxID=2862949 RepID=UPI001CD3FEC9|nr:YbaB/EbfC family nucleoid-associated protein [Nocardia sp. alder85J]MCX4093077.1 YbaB/EbfC family nucleoid-associated protein [Nocardia sp. alder85J]
MIGEQWARLEAGAQARLGRMRQLSDDLAAVRVRHTAAGGAVTITVDGSAKLLDLELSEYISQMSPTEFARVVIDTAAAAAQLALARRAALIDEFNDEMNI